MLRSEPPAARRDPCAGPGCSRKGAGGGRRGGIPSGTALILLGVLVLALAGCGSGDAVTTTSMTGSASTVVTNASPATTTAPVAGGPAAAAFSGTTVDGEQVSLASFVGKPLVLAFWASW